MHNLKTTLYFYVLGFCLWKDAEFFICILLYVFKIISEFEVKF